MLVTWKMSLPALLLIACGSPAPAEPSLSLVSDHRLVDADVQIVTPVRLGENQLFVDLRAHDGEQGVSLEAVNATMAAHGHEAHAGTIAPTATGYHVSELDLFMSGRWQVELELLIDERSDSISLPVDVP